MAQQLNEVGENVLTADLNVAIPATLKERLDHYVFNNRKKVTQKSVVAQALQEFLDRQETSAPVGNGAI